MSKQELRLFVVASVIGHFKVLADDWDELQVRSSSHSHKAQKGNLEQLE
jgi:hypothetical protein